MEAAAYLQPRVHDGKLVLTDLVLYISERQRPRAYVQRPAVALHEAPPVAADPPLLSMTIDLGSSCMTIDLGSSGLVAHHRFRLLPA
jgi:hypothetical protein